MEEERIPQLPHELVSRAKTGEGSNVHIEHRFNELTLRLVTNRMVNQANTNPLNR